MEPQLTITVGDILIPIEPRTIVPAGKIVVDNRVITHELVIGKPAFIRHPGYLEPHEALGIIYAGILYIDTPDNQESIIYGDQKPAVLISSNEFVQFIVQPLSYLKGKTKTPLMWELSTMPVTIKPSLRVGKELLNQGE